MATTETEYNHHHHQHQHEACNNNWSCPELPSDHQDPEDVSISEILDHGSISFGRFAAESLAWEKWSVFPHNRCQEELEQFKSPGLVAKKKAYFEEYYRKIRAMKTLQAEQQETNQPDLCQDAQSNITKVQNGVDADASKQGNKCGNTGQIQISDGDMTVVVDKSDQTVNEPKSYCYINNDIASIVDGTSVSLSIVEGEQSVKNSSPYRIPTISRYLKGVLHDNHNADEVKHNANKTREHAPVLKAKGTTASAGNKKKLNCKTMTNAAKQSEKTKPSVHRAITGKADSCLVSSRSTPKAASNSKPNCVSSHRQLPDVGCSPTVLSTSLRREKMGSSSSIIKGGQANTNSSPISLADKLSSKLPVRARSAQCTSKEITSAGGLRKSTLENRSGSIIRRLKGGESKNQRPKVMASNIPAQNKSNQNVGTEFSRRSYVMEGKQKEGIDKISARLRKDLKPASSTLSIIQKSPNPELVDKIAPWRSADMMHDRKEPRQRMPIWR